MRERRRVVVTGIGLVTPLGVGLEKTWKALVEGRSGIAPITQFDTTEHATKFAGEVKGFDPLAFMDKRDAKWMDRCLQLGLAAASMALADSGFVVTDENAEQVGSYIGSGLAGVATIERTHASLVAKGPRHGISPYFIPGITVNMTPGLVTIRWGMKGPNMSHVSACSTGAHSIGEAARLIQRGDAIGMVAGGTEATITPLGIGGFNAMRAMSTRNAEPEKASRPWDADRTGFVMGEGAGVLFLEELEHARQRGAHVYAELTGYGASSDAFHMVQPPDAGEGAQRCMRLALRDARRDASDVVYVNAHGTSTRQGDIAETRALEGVFGAHAQRVMVSSTKSMTGHMFGAAGGVEAAFAVLAVARNVIPPTINLDTPDPECPLDYVPHTAREVVCPVALSNSFGFGGTNATLVFERV